MRYRQLDANGDMTFGSGQLNFIIDSPAAVAQAVMTSLKLWLGEWYLNINDGTPYPEGVIGYHSQTQADQTIQAQIAALQVTISSTNVPYGFQPGQVAPAITSIINYQSSIDTTTRAYTATCILNTIYGPTPLEISNYPNF